MVDGRVFLLVEWRFVDPGVHAVQEDVDKVGWSKVFFAGDSYSFVQFCDARVCGQGGCSGVSGLGLPCRVCTSNTRRRR